MACCGLRMRRQTATIIAIANIRIRHSQPITTGLGGAGSVGNAQKETPGRPKPARGNF